MREKINYRKTRNEVEKQSGTFKRREKTRRTDIVCLLRNAIGGEVDDG